MHSHSCSQPCLLCSVRHALTCQSAASPVPHSLATHSRLSTHLLLPQQPSVTLTQCASFHPLPPATYVSSLFHAQVLGTGAGQFDPALHTSSLNLMNPILRDTTLLPMDGWVYLRFRANNPGIWALHCHILWHSFTGQEVRQCVNCVACV